MTSETPQSNVDDNTINAAFLLSIVIGLITLFSGLVFDYQGAGVFIAGICFLVAPFALGALGLLLVLISIGVANPQVGLILLVSAGCIVCICVYGAFMLFPLGFTLTWTSLITAILGHGFKYWYYRKMAIVVEARFHSKERVCYTTDKGPQVRYEWIGDYEVPVSGNKTKQASLRVHKDCQENEHDTIFEILCVRKKFIVSHEKFDETVREAYVLPKFPKHAILAYDVATTKEKVLLIVFLSVFVVGFGIFGLGMPISSFSGSGRFWVPCTDWRVIDSYLIIVGMACLATLHYTFDDSLSREAIVLMGGGQELQELDSKLQHNGDDERTASEMTLDEERVAIA
eukprot:CAMPEP_0194151898 /NCGR_PEP_ID=MMETSP0152-20130528/49932_1 /TAXON_ID=1049557 /ORGANISM="Thalassiothrix antarctica, Strain L6-D1" /LENGTH=342 /DNA_ID=CAMNT_0038856019 /DNA_START=1 /DNA_END=1029 /DNA_ORIENTATION=-